MGDIETGAAAPQGRWKRVLLKLSGEALAGDKGFGIDGAVVERIAGEIAQAIAMGVQVGVVVGGGNLIRGAQIAAKGGDRVAGDHMGMLGTIMNCLALHGALKHLGIPSTVLSSLAVPAVCETFTQRAALRCIAQGDVLLFAGGTGNPFFTTDTGAALKAAEIGCDALLKGTQVDGIYTADPKKDPTATRYDRLTHSQVLERGLAVMDAAAIALARDNHIPVIVFSIQKPGALIGVLTGREMATIVDG